LTKNEISAIENCRWAKYNSMTKEIMLSDLSRYKLETKEGQAVIEILHENKIKINGLNLGPKR
jgi:hypothetical protein